MKNTLASVWETGKGILIFEVEAGRFLFHFFHEVDIAAVLNEGPWSFNHNILVLTRITETDQVGTVPLTHVSFWVQIYNLPMGFHSCLIVQSIGEYVGKFIAHDPENFCATWRNYLRVRVSIDTQKPRK